MIARLLLTASLAAVAAPALAAPASVNSDAGHDHGTDWLVEDDAASDAMEIDTPTMSFGEWGVDPAGLDPSIAPGDDFFAHVNAKWLAANPLPPEFSRFGAFNLLREKSTSDVKAVVDELAQREATLGADEKRIVDAYNAFADTDAIEANGLAQAQPYLDRIAGAETLAELVTLWSQPGMPSPLGGFVTVDQKEPDRYTVYVASGGLGLPDRDYYFDDTEKGVDIQQKYREYLAFLLKENGDADAGRNGAGGV